MARSKYHEEPVERFETELMYFIKMGVEKQRHQEQEEDIHEALRIKSASEFLRRY
jgi:hypothetical protein